MDQSDYYVKYLDMKKKYLCYKKQLGGNIDNITAIGDIHGDLKLLIILLRDIAKIIVPKAGMDPTRLQNIFNHQSMGVDNMDNIIIKQNPPQYYTIDPASNYDPLFGYELDPTLMNQTVVLMGDYIDGYRKVVDTLHPDLTYPFAEIKILLLINALCDNAISIPTNNYSIIKLLGNHEINHLINFSVNESYIVPSELIRTFQGEPRFYGDTFFTAYMDVTHEYTSYFGAPITRSYNQYLPDELQPVGTAYGILIKYAKFIHKIDKYIFVHGGIPFQKTNFYKYFNFEHTNELNNCLLKWLDNGNPEFSEMKKIFTPDGFIYGGRDFMASRNIDKIQSILTGTKTTLIGTGHDGLLWTRDIGNITAGDCAIIDQETDNFFNKYTIIVGHCPNYTLNLFPKGDNFDYTAPDNISESRHTILNNNGIITMKTNPEHLVSRSRDDYFGISTDCMLKFIKVDCGMSRSFDRLVGAMTEGDVVTIHNQIYEILDKIYGKSLDDVINILADLTYDSMYNNSFLQYNMSRLPQVLKINNPQLPTNDINILCMSYNKTLELLSYCKKNLSDEMYDKLSKLFMIKNMYNPLIGVTRSQCEILLASLQ